MHSYCLLQTQASQVEAEVKAWAEQYRKAVEAHGRALCTAAARARARYQQKVEEQNRELDERAHQAMDAVKFAEEVGDIYKEEFSSVDLIAI